MATIPAHNGHRPAPSHVTLAGVASAKGRDAAAPTTSDLAVYMRVSGEEQRRRHTIENQRTALDRYLAAYDLVPYGWYEDEAVSGKWIAFPERPEGRRLLADAKVGHVQTVLVAKLDRFGRNAREILDAVHELEQAGAHLVSLKEHFDTSTPVGRLMLTMLAAIAEYEWEMIMDRTEAGMERRLQGNGWMGGPAPYGYSVEGKGKDAHLVVADESAFSSLADHRAYSLADVVRLIFRLAVDEGQTCMAIADRLNQMGVPTAFARRQLRFKRKERDEPAMGIWRANAVNGILSNAIYKGEYRFGRRTRRHGDEAHGEPRELATCEMPPLVSAQTWEAAQAGMARHLLYATRNAKRDYLLRGLMQCGTCGHQYVGDGPRYSCYAARHPAVLYGRELAKTKRCHALPLPAAWIEAEVWGDINGYLHDPGPALAMMAARMSGQADQAEALRADLTRTHQQQDTKQQERDRVVAAFRKGTITERDLRRQLNDVAREEVELAKAAQAITSQLAVFDDVAAKVAGADALLRDLRDRLDGAQLTPALRRQFVEKLVQGVTVRTEENPETGAPHAVAHVLYVFDPPHDLGIVSSTPGDTGFNAVRAGGVAATLEVAKIADRRQ